MSKPFVAGKVERTTAQAMARMESIQYRETGGILASISPMAGIVAEVVAGQVALMF